MSYSTYRFTLNLQSHRSQAVVKAFKGDINIKLIMSLSDGGNAYRIENGCTVTITGTRADNTKIEHTGTIVDNTVVYRFDKDTTSVAGLVTCELTLYNADGLPITSPKFTIDVDEKEVDNTVPIQPYGSEAIGVVMGAAAKEHGREQSELARQANEVQRQKSYDEAREIANEVKDELPTKLNKEKLRHWKAYNQDWSKYGVTPDETVYELANEAARGKDGFVKGAPYTVVGVDKMSVCSYRAKDGETGYDPNEVTGEVSRMDKHGFTKYSDGGSKLTRFDGNGIMFAGVVRNADETLSLDPSVPQKYIYFSEESVPNGVTDPNVIATNRDLRDIINKISYDSTTQVLTFDYKGYKKTIDLLLEKTITGVEDRVNPDNNKPEIRFIFGDQASDWYSFEQIIKLGNYVTIHDFNERLPENLGSSTHRLYVAPPEGFTDEDGKPVYGYLKRLAGYNGGGKSSSNGETGIITKNNRQQKLDEGLINETGFNNYVTHDEPTEISIACRDDDGRLVIEDGEKRFHAVNKRQLDKALDDCLKKDPSQKYVVYGIGNNGNNIFFPVSKGTEAKQGEIPRYIANGNLILGENPTAGKHATPKSYVDNLVKGRADKTYVDSKVNEASDALSRAIARLSAKVFGAEVKDVNLADYLNDPEYASTVETFVQNSVGLYSLKLEAEYEMEDAWGNTLAVANILPDIKVIPRKTLIWDTPVECEVVTDTLRIDYYGNTAEEWIENPRVVSCAIELSSDNNTCINVYARISYTYVWYNIEEGTEERYDDIEMSVMFQVPWESWNGGWTDQRVITSVLVNEQTRPFLPTTYSLRGDVTETEINMANEMDGLIEKMKAVRDRKASQQEDAE